MIPKRVARHELLTTSRSLIKLLIDTHRKHGVEAAMHPGGTLHDIRDQIPSSITGRNFKSQVKNMHASFKQAQAKKNYQARAFPTPSKRLDGPAAGRRDPDDLALEIKKVAALVGHQIRVAGGVDAQGAPQVGGDQCDGLCLADQPVRVEGGLRKGTSEGCMLYVGGGPGTYPSDFKACIPRGRLFRDTDGHVDASR